MRHRVALKKLNADTQHRVAMRRNLAASLILHGRVVTTTAKAKAFRPFVERIVTRARRAWAIKDSDRPAYIHALRILRRDIHERDVLKILVEKIAPLCATRQGGYTRILRHAKNQLGDNAPRAIWEFVDRPAQSLEDTALEGEDAAAKGKGADAKGGKKPSKPGATKAGGAKPTGADKPPARAKGTEKQPAATKPAAKPSDEQGEED